MKKFLTIVALFGALSLAGVSAQAQDKPAEQAAATAAAATAAPAATTAPVAAEAPAPEVKKLDSGSTAWMITATVLVMLMTIPGLALFYGGLVRAKNMLSVLMQVFVIFSLVSILWAVYGYSLAFTEGPVNSIIGGFGKAFLAGIKPDTLSGVIPEYVFVVFQLTFAAITPALIVGGFAERMKFSAILWFMALWLTFCYVPIAHMVWGGGFLAGLGYVPIAHMVWGGGFLAGLGAKDFAGGTVVHVNAGIAALVGCVMLGKRIGYGREAMPPHNLTLTMVGASLLWVGWFGFNVGSELAADGIAGMVLVNTQLATAAAVLGWMLVEWIGRGKPTMLGAASGAVAGLVAITPACGFVGPMGSIILGFVAGMVCFWGVTGLKSKFGYDDSLDVFGVHGIGGILGALGTGILMSESFGGVGYDKGVTMIGQVITQAIAVGVTLVWTGIISYILYKLVDMMVGLRVAEDSERQGLDSTQHGEVAYHI